MIDYSYSPALKPFVAKRAPTIKDSSLPGKIWVDEVNDDVYVMTSKKNGSNIWIGTGGGAETLSSLTVNPGNITLTQGNLVLTSGNIVNTSMNAGVVIANDEGLLGSSTGENGEILIGNTATGIPLWGAITCSDDTVDITLGANSISLSVQGVVFEAGPKILSGTGAPTLVAPKGSLYLNASGTSVDEIIYVNTDGDDTWEHVVTPT